MLRRCRQAQRCTVSMWENAQMTVLKRCALGFVVTSSIAFWLFHGFAPLTASAADVPVPSSVGNPSLAASAGYPPQSELSLSGDAYDFTSPKSSMGTWAGEQ